MTLDEANLLLSEWKDDVIDVGISSTLTKAELQFPESDNPSVILQFEDNRHIGEFQLWIGSESYAITIIETASELHRAFIDKLFFDIAEPLAAADFIIQFFAGRERPLPLDETNPLIAEQGTAAPPHQPAV